MSKYCIVSKDIIVKCLMLHQERISWQSHWSPFFQIVGLKHKEKDCDFTKFLEELSFRIFASSCFRICKTRNILNQFFIGRQKRAAAGGGSG